MNKSTMVWLATGLFVVGISSNALALTMSYTVPGYDLGILMNAKANTSASPDDLKFIDFTFNLTAYENISNAFITLFVQDDKGVRDGSEKGTFTYEGQPAPVVGRTASEKRKIAKTIKNNSDINSNYWKSNFIVDAAAFTEDGIATGRLTATAGDFWFRSVRLTFTGDLVVNNETQFMELGQFVPGGAGQVGRDDSLPVPEPATMLLFGTGVASLAAVGRRKRS